MFIRISRGSFDPAIADEVEAMLRTSAETLVPAIERLPGNIRYYAAFDRASRTMVNVSVWTSERHALQMGHLLEMRRLSQEFKDKGVRFEVVTNYETSWDING